MEEINIRKVKFEDNSKLAGVIRQVFEEFDAPRCGTVFSDPTTDNLFELFQEERSVLWVAEDRGELLGCCGIYPTQGLPTGCAELVKLYLSSASRGRGIGLALIEKSIDSARELGYQSLYLESLPIFSKAIKMYEKQGFEMQEKALGNSGHSSCNVWMLKRL